MGVCSSSSKPADLPPPPSSSPKKSIFITTYDNVELNLQAPPNLLQRRLPSNFGLIVASESLKDKLIDEELNRNLESGGKIDSALGELIQTNSLKERDFTTTAETMFELIFTSLTKKKEYLNPKMFKRILEDYNTLVFQEYTSVLGKSGNKLFDNDKKFCIKMICHTTEVYQILLSYRIEKRDKKKKKKMVYWWINEKPDPNDEDTYNYLRKKFKLICRDLTNQFKTLLGQQGESQPLQRLPKG